MVSLLRRFVGRRRLSGLKNAHCFMSTKHSSLTQKLNLRTSKRTELQNITEELDKIVSSSGCTTGVCHLYVPHTTAGILINEGYDPDVARDLEVALDRLVPRKGDYLHAEGNSDSHIKTSLVGSSATVWIEDGRLLLGRWQMVFFAEFDGPRRRELLVKILPDPSA